jgi:Fe2+ or Zn2+ uptake regulation protein
MLKSRIGLDIAMSTRRTRQREAILRILKRTTAHPTADWLYDEVRKEIPNISKGTVYRNLNFLRQTGEILELNPDGTVTRYDGRPDNHYHFSCEKCGRVFDVDEPVGPEFDRRVAQKTGFQVNRHTLEFFGLCRDCQKERQSTFRAKSVQAPSRRLK